jgi:opacity protein-like surface antigen
MPMRATLMGMSVAMLLAGCSMGRDVSTADKAIDAFHGQLNAGRFDALYAASSPVMKKLANQAAFDEFLSTVRTKLGSFKSGKTLGWNDTINASGHLVTVNYSANYDRGTAQENFVFSVNGDQTSLVGYHIDSMTLLTK